MTENMPKRGVLFNIDFRILSSLVKKDIIKKNENNVDNCNDCSIQIQLI